MTRRIAWLAGLGIAVMVALLMRSLDSDWLTTLSTAALNFIVLPDMVARKHSPIAEASTQRRSRTTGKPTLSQRQMSLNGSGDMAV